MVNPDNEVDKIVSALKEGKFCLIPTDSVWVISCDARNNKRVNEFHSWKNTSMDPITLLMGDSKDLQMYVKKVPDITWDIVDYSSKPLTVIYDEWKNLVDDWFAGQTGIAIRVSSDLFVQKIVKKLGRPIFTYMIDKKAGETAMTEEEIPSEIRSKADYVSEYKGNKIGKGVLPVLMELSENGSVKFLRK